jgi:hypothetical protein
VQVSSLSSSSTPPSSGGVVEQVKRLAGVLADGSGASDQDKITAYTSILKAYADSSNSGSGWFQSSTQDERDAVNAVLDTSSMAQQIRKAADDFNARGMSADRTTNVMASQISYLNGLSDMQQQLIFAGSALTAQTPTLESWKGFLQENADGRAKQMADEAAEKAPVKVTLSDQAKAALAAEPSPDKQALDALAKGDVEDGVAGAALRMLRKAAEERAEAADRKAGEAKPYEIGDAVDKAV